LGGILAATIYENFIFYTTHCGFGWSIYTSVALIVLFFKKKLSWILIGLGVHILACAIDAYTLKTSLFCGRAVCSAKFDMSQFASSEYDIHGDVCKFVVGWVR
jgi:hypothetical protein